MVSYTIHPQQPDSCLVQFTFKCLAKMPRDWAQIMHMIPANPAGLETGTERQVGLKGWDNKINPATTTWEVGKTYAYAVQGKLPAAGAPWTIEYGLCELLDGRLGGRYQVQKLTTPSGLQTNAKNGLAILATDVGK